MMGPYKQGELRTEHTNYNLVLTFIILQNNLYSTKWRQNLHDS